MTYDIYPLILQAGGNLLIATDRPKGFRSLGVRLNCITRENLRELLRSAYDAVLSGGISAGQQRGLRRHKVSSKAIKRKRNR